MNRIDHKAFTPGQDGAYRSWMAMRNRCKFHRLYAGIVKICERWDDFYAFLADMGERPEGKSLDRFPNNKGDYEPSNCRWATQEAMTPCNEPGCVDGWLTTISGAEKLCPCSPAKAAVEAVCERCSQPDSKCDGYNCTEQAATDAVSLPAPQSVEAVGETSDAPSGSVERLWELKLWLDRQYNRHHEMEDIEAGNAICELITTRASLQEMRGEVADVRARWGNQSETIGLLTRSMQERANIIAAKDARIVELEIALKTVKSGMYHAGDCHSRVPMSPPRGFHKHQCDCGRDAAMAVIEATLQKGATPG